MLENQLDEKISKRYLGNLLRRLTEFKGFIERDKESNTFLNTYFINDFLSQNSTYCFNDDINFYKGNLFPKGKVNFKMIYSLLMK